MVADSLSTTHAEPGLSATERGLMPTSTSESTALSTLSTTVTVSLSGLTTQMKPVTSSKATWSDRIGAPTVGAGYTI